MLDSVGGNQDRAIDALLIMGDPEYKGEPLVAVQSEHPPLVRSTPPIPIHYFLLRYSPKQN